MKFNAESRPRAARRGLALLSGGVVVVAMLAGCAGNSAKSSGASSPASSASSTIVLGMVGSLDTLSPYPINVGNRPWIPAVDDPLVGQGAIKSGQIAPTVTPRLAQSWTTSADGKTYEFHLRKGLKFSDGTALDAAAVVKFIQWSADINNHASGYSLFAASNPTAVNNLTVKMSFSTPQPSLMSTLSLSPVVDVSSPDVATTPAGDGPYKVKSFQPNTLLTLVPNPQYWDAKAVGRFQQIQVRVFQNSSSASAALSSGQIQILSTPPSSLLPTLTKQGMSLTKTSPIGNYTMTANVSSGPLANVDVRRALMYTLDRKTFAKVAGGGVSQPDCSFYPPGTAPYTKAAADSCSFNLAKAKSMLAKAGYPNGLTLSFLTSAAQNPETDTFGPIWKNDLAKIGVTLNLDEVDSTTFTSRGLAWNFQLNGGFYSQSNVDPAQLFSSQQFRTVKNGSLYQSAEYTNLVTEANSELDPTKRIALYQKLNLFLIDQAFKLPIGTAVITYASRPGVPKLTLDPNGQLEWGQVSP